MNVLSDITENSNLDTLNTKKKYNPRLTDGIRMILVSVEQWFRNAIVDQKISFNLGSSKELTAAATGYGLTTVKNALKGKETTQAIGTRCDKMIGEAEKAMLISIIHSFYED